MTVILNIINNTAIKNWFHREPLFPARVALSGCVYCDFQERKSCRKAYLPVPRGSLLLSEVQGHGNLVRGMKQASLGIL